MAKFAEDYRLHAKGLDIDGEEFPWWVAMEGPKVEAIDQYLHLLWVPVMVKKPAPGFWDGRGEALVADEDTLSGSNRRSVAPGDADDLQGPQIGTDGICTCEATVIESGTTGVVIGPDTLDPNCVQHGPGGIYELTMRDEEGAL